MDRIVSPHSTIKLLLVIALSLMLSCVTAPGIRTSDVAELHYGDREEAVVEQLGEGSEILYFMLDGKQYRYRLPAARMPLRTGRVPNSSSISRCMHLKSSNASVHFNAYPARYSGSVFPVSCVTFSIPITTQVVSVL